MSECLCLCVVVYMCNGVRVTCTHLWERERYPQFFFLVIFLPEITQYQVTKCSLMLCLSAWDREGGHHAPSITIIPVCQGPVL